MHPVLATWRGRCGAVTAFFAALLITDAALGAAAPVGRQVPGFYRMELGDFEVTALLDGTHNFPVEAVMTNAGPRRVAKLLRDADAKIPLEGSINAFLVNTGKRLILIDTGAGALYGNDGGHLVGNLRAAGYSPEQVDEIYLTHLHRDHVGGLLAGGVMAFPNAIVRASKADADYWLSRANQARAPKLLSSMFDGAIESLAPYLAVGHFKTFEGPGELSAGFRPISRAGHTPGHTSYAIRSRDQLLVVWGDLVHVEPVQFPAPEIRVRYDSDGTFAETARRSAFEEAANTHQWVAAAHIAFPGLGHVTRDGHGYRWLPAPFSLRVESPVQTAPASSQH